MLRDDDFAESYPVVHDNADLSEVYRRLAWKWQWDRSKVLASFATIGYSKEAIEKLNGALVLTQ